MILGRIIRRDFWQRTTDSPGVLPAAAQNRGTMPLRKAHRLSLCNPVQVLHVALSAHHKAFEIQSDPPEHYILRYCSGRHESSLHHGLRGTNMRRYSFPEIHRPVWCNYHQHQIFPGRQFLAARDMPLCTAGYVRLLLQVRAYRASLRYR